MSRRTYCNLDEADKTRALVTSYTNGATPRVPSFIRESELQNCRFFFVQDSGDESSGQPFTWADPSTWQLIVGAGTIGVEPTDGGITLTDPDAGQTTAAIDWDADYLTVQAAVRLGLSTNWSLAIVTGGSGAPWTITNGANGARSKLNATATALQPANSTAIVTRTQPGTASLPAQMFVEFARALPIGRSSGWTAVSKIATAITVHQAGDATHNKVFKIKIDPDAYSGDVQLLFTGDSVAEQLVPIAYNASADDVKGSFEAHSKVGVDGVPVVKEGPGEWYVTLIAATIDLDNTPTLTTPGDTIKVPPGLEGSLLVNTAGTTLTLNGATSALITFE